MVFQKKTNKNPLKHPEQRVGVFIDVQNMYYSAKNLYNKKVNFGNIVTEAVAGRKLIRSIAYVVRTESKEEQPFFDALYNLGIETKEKDLQIFADGMKKADWDVGLAVDAIRLASSLDAVVIVSGDGDYIPLVEYLQSTGKQVEALAFGETSSSKLIGHVDDFIDLGQDLEKYLITPQKSGVVKTQPKPAPSRSNVKPVRTIKNNTKPNSYSRLSADAMVAANVKPVAKIPAKKKGYFGRNKKV